MPVSPQAEVGCPCPEWTDEEACIKSRVDNPRRFDSQYYEICECLCHDRAEDGDDDVA